MININLSKIDLLAVHEATLRVLADVGIMLDDPESKSLLFDNGAIEKNQRVCIPPELVEKCLQQCPTQVELIGREQKIILGDGNLHVHNLGGARDVYEPSTGLLRPATCQDIAISSRLMDGLENVSSITPLYTPRDVASHMMILSMFVETVRNTLKPVNGPGVRNSKEIKLLIEIARTVFGDRPQISLSASPVSPLNFQGDVAQSILEISRQGVAFGPLPCPSVGATSPMSLAGSLVLQNAEVLACIVLAQLTQPGLPIVYCGRLSVLNMHSGSPIWGNPETGLASAGTVAIAHHYHLPVNVYGLSDSGYSIDVQSGYERAINALTPALAGADELSGVGEMAGGIYSCNAQIMIDNDIYGMIQRLKQGILVNEDSLAVDVIKHAMDHSRNFMMEQHTRRYLRSGELWQGRLGVPESTWEQWYNAGKPTVVDRAQAIADQVLNSHEIPPLEEHQIREIQNIMLRADHELEGL